MADEKPKPPLKLFISYSHDDDDLRQIFVKHIAQLEDDGLIEPWHDRRITGGTEWEPEIYANLGAAQLIVLLVSKSFLASDYCKLETKLALGLHDQRKARVVPVIVRPCDWETAHFAKLQVYPTDGKPVAQWRPQDRGWVNVVKGLRRVVEEVCGSAKIVRFHGIEVAVPKGRKFWVAAAGIAALLLVALGIWWSIFQTVLAEGERKLDVGDYSHAKSLLEKAAVLNPLSRRAASDLQTVAIDGMRGDPQSAKSALDDSLKRAPNNPYLHILLGQYFFGQRDLAAAQSEFEASVRLNPALAEGHHALGIIFDQRGDHERALASFKNAARLSSGSERYKADVADQLYKTDHLRDAAGIFDLIKTLPDAAVEGATVHRLLGELATAETKNVRALELLNDSKNRELPENRDPWKEDSPYGSFDLASDTEKLCFAEAELAATLFLEHKGEWERNLDQAKADCGSRWREVGAMIYGELDALVKQQPAFGATASEFQEKLR